ncbi:MAG: hypothetical protein ACOC35_10660 [Promethearchaeia archaeon]
MEELINFKLRFLKERIEEILQKWNYRSINKFLEDSKDGTLSEAEEDAIILKNLRDQVEDLTEKKRELTAE